MAWTNHQKALLQLYRRSARLPDLPYRGLLHEVAGVRTSTHRGLTQYHYDQVMARIEGLLDCRIAEGLCPPPASPRIANLHYWRNRLPRVGAANTRQIHRLYDLWRTLRPILPDNQRTDGYLLAVASRACGSPIAALTSLTASQAGLLLEALKDRLAHALAHHAN